METTTLIGPKKIFNGYATTYTAADGSSLPCFVVNHSSSMAFKDGSNGAAVKIKVGQYVAPRSPYAERSGIRYYSESIWVKAERAALVKISYRYE